MAKKLLEIGVSDEDIFKAKIELAEELKNYDKVKNNEQIKALVDFLEYLFLIKDPELERKFEEYKSSQGGAFKMTIEEIRKMHYTQKGREEGIEKGIEKEKLAVAEKMLRKGIAMDMIIELTGLEEEQIKKLQKSIIN